LGDHGAIDVFDHRVNDALGVDEDGDLIHGMLKSQWASMTSNPLFISEAESMVIFFPISQRGW